MKQSLTERLQGEAEKNCPIYTTPYKPHIDTLIADTVQEVLKEVVKWNEEHVDGGGDLPWGEQDRFLKSLQDIGHVKEETNMNNKTPKETQAVEEELQNIMEDYLMLAEMKSFAKDPVKHMEEMRKHWNILKDFIEQTLKTVEARGHTEGVRKYNELLLEVRNKYEGENRHQTALRIIRENQNSISQGAEALTPTDDGA